MGTPARASLSQQQATQLPLKEQLADFHQLRRNGASADLCIERLHAIGRLGSKQAVDALMKLMPQLQGSLQMAAVHAIYLANSPYAFEQLRDLSNHRRNDAVRRQACRDLLLVGAEYHVFLRDQRLVREKNLMLRGEVLRGLLLHRVPNLEEAILKAAKSKDSIYAAAGVFGIGRLRLEHGRKLVEAAAQSSDIPLRRDALQALSLLGGASSVSLLMQAFVEPRNLMLRPQISAWLRGAHTRPELEAIIAKGLPSKNKELVRIAADIISVAAPRLPSLCNPSLFDLLNHSDSQVRNVALEGLVHAQSQEVVATLLTRLSDEDPQSCCDALWALQELDALPANAEPRVVELASHPNPVVRVQATCALKCFPQSKSAFSAALRLLHDDSWVVRAAAIDSLVFLRHKQALPNLIALMQHEEGRLREDAARALAQLSGVDFGTQISTWKRWLEDRPPDYQLPTLEEAQVSLQTLHAARDRSNHSVVQNSYFGLTVPPGGVVFVLDMSESMAQPYNDQQSYYQHFSQTLSSTLGRLPAETKFNVVLFSNGVKIWSNGLRSASAINIHAAQEFLNQTKPSGGTNLLAALQAAFSFTETQTIFLLTDGTPTLGRITAPDGLLRELERWNRNRHIHLHTIAAGSDGADFLAELALTNGGQATDLSTAN